MSKTQDLILTKSEINSMAWPFFCFCYLYRVSVFDGWQKLLTAVIVNIHWFTSVFSFWFFPAVYKEKYGEKKILRNAMHL